MASKPKREIAVEVDGRRVLACNRCEKLCASRKQIVNGYGPTGAKIAYVGEAPGDTEDAKGRPFIGAAGQTARGWFRQCGVDPERDVFWTNAVRCHPKDNGDPSLREIKNCHDFLMEELRVMKPSIICAAGNSACKALLPEHIYKEGITKLRGHVFWHEELGCKVIPMFHPSAGLYDWDKEPICIADIRKALKEAKNPQTMPQGMGEYFVCLTPEEVEELCADMMQSEFVVFDTETAHSPDVKCEDAGDKAALNWRHAAILCLSLTDREGTGWTVPFWGQHFRPIWKADEWTRVVAALKNLLENHPSLIGQNAKFDQHMVKEYLGINADHVVFDTMLGTHLVYENISRSLESLRSLFTTMPYYDDEVAKQTDGKAHMEWAEEDVIWTYAAADVDCTFRVANAVAPLLDKEGDKAWWVFQNVAMPLAAAARHMEEKGVLIDMNLAADLIDECDKLIAQFERETLECVPPNYDINLASPAQMKKLFYETLKLPKPPILTDSGEKCKHCRDCKNPNDQHVFHTSTDKDAVQWLADHVDHAIVLPFRTLTQLHTLRKTFLLGEDTEGTKKRKSGLLQHVQEDDRIHTNVRVDGTETGRVSTSPNMQNIPKAVSKEEGDRPEIYQFIRKLFIAPEGYDFLNADYSQLELRVMAYIAGEAEMIKRFEADEDIHLFIARHVLFKKTDTALSDADWKKKHKGLRDRAKVFDFGIGYGLTTWGVMNRFGCTEKEAEEFIRFYFTHFVHVRDYFHKKDRRLKKDHRAENAVGRPRHFNGVESMRGFGGYRRKYNHMRRENYNFDIQSTGSDFLSLAMIHIDKDEEIARLGGRIVLTVHDSIMLEAPKATSKEVAWRVKEIMQQVPRELKNWYMPAEVQGGQRWGVWDYEIAPEEKRAA